MCTGTDERNRKGLKKFILIDSLKFFLSKLIAFSLFDLPIQNKSEKDGYNE
jgi:hypothetical protein